MFVKAKWNAAAVCLSMLLGLVVTSNSAARVILEPISVTSPQGSFSNPTFGLVHMIDESGLTTSYTGGLTDFDSYVPTTLHNSPGAGTNSGFTNQAGGFPQTITFDLGSVFNLSGLGFWGTGNIGSVTQFQLFADTDAVFTNGGTTQLGSTFNALPGTGSDLGQIFNFTAFATEFIHLRVLNTTGGTGLIPGIGEAAFASGAVPEPATAMLLIVALLGLAASRPRTLK
jgi:hypothetical protein